MRPILAGLFPILLLALVPTAAGQELFKEEAAIRGLVYPVQQNSTFGCGLAFADLDNDGDPDVVLLGKTSAGLPPGTVGLYENDGTGHFLSRAGGSGIPIELEACGVNAVDYDGDGDLDLYLSVWLEPNLLLRNEGNFQFTSVGADPAMGGIDDGGAGQGNGWADFDGDHYLDLYLANRTGTNYPSGPPSTESNRLFRNLAGAGFEDVAVQHGVDRGTDRSFQGAWFDYDRDGDADLYLSNDKGLSTNCLYRNHLWENLGGSFLDISASSGTDGCIDAMCIAFGDLDGNGFQDIYVSNVPAGNPLYLNQGDGTFVEAGDAYGVASYQVGWGSAFLDYDNDTWLDLYVCQHANANRLFDFDGVPPAVDVAPLLDVADPGQSFSCATGDADGDGDLDLLVSNRNGMVRLYMNQEGQQRSWAKFRVVGEGANTWGVGANVEVTAGARSMLREVVAGDGFKSQNDLVLHFGLGAAVVLDTVLAEWPGGPARTLAGYPAMETWTLYPPSRLGDEDGDGLVDQRDLQALAACWEAPVAPGCEMLDFDGDAWIGAADLPGFLARYTGHQGDCNGNGTEDVRDILDGSSADADGDGVPDECEMVFEVPVPGLAAAVNSFRVTGAVPGARVIFAYSLRAGATGVPGCPGLQVALAGPTVLGAVNADGGGAAQTSRFVPAAASGRTVLFQAVQRDSCRVSTLRAHAFP